MLAPLPRLSLASMYSRPFLAASPIQAPSRHSPASALTPRLFRAASVIPAESRQSETPLWSVRSPRFRVVSPIPARYRQGQGVFLASLTRPFPEVCGSLALSRPAAAAFL